MATWEWKVVPAPRKASKRRGRLSPAERFALTIAEAINGAAAEGWEFVRAERLVCETKGFWRRGGEAEHDLLVFRRATDAARVVPPEAPAAREAAAREAPAVHAAPSAHEGLRLAPVGGREGPVRAATLGPASREAPERAAQVPPLKP